MAQVSGIEVKFSADTGNLERGISKAQGAISGFAKGAAAALAGALSAGVFIAAGKAAINYADEIGKMSQKVGISAEALSGLSYAARLADVSMGELQMGLQQLSKNMEAGSKGLTALGISATDASGNLRAADLVLSDVAEAFAGMEDGAGKTAIAMDIFGRSGANLIPLLNSGRSGIQQMSDEASRFGVIITSEAAAAAEQFNDNLTRMTAIMQGVVQNTTASLLPALNDITDAFISLANNSPSSAGAIGLINDGLRLLTETALNAYPAIWAIGELATTAFTDPLNSEAWATSLERIRMQAEAADEAIAKLYAGEAQTVNREAKTDFGGAGTKTKPPRLPGTETDTQTDADKMREPGIYREEDPFFIDRLEQIREQFKTEREVLEQEYALNQETVRNALNNGLIEKDQFNALELQMAEDHQKKLNAIKMAGVNTQLSAAADLFGSLAQLTDSGNKKLMKLSKAFSIAQVVINTAQGISKAFAQFGWPAGIGPAAAIAASGAVQLANIASAESGKIKGGGGGGSGGGKGSTASSGGGTGGGGAGPTTTFSFTLMNDPMGFGEKFARQFIDQLNSTQRNGGQIRGVIA